MGLTSTTPGYVAQSFAAVRQTVLSGAVDSNGQAAILRAGTGLAVDLLASTVPVAMTLAAGFDALGPLDKPVLISADQVSAWTGLPASTTAYLYVDRNSTTGKLTYGYSTVAPQYGVTATVLPSTTDVTTSAQAISNGNNGNPVANAFDKNTGTYWGSANSAPACNGVDYAGQDFGGSPKAIQRVYINQYPTTGGDGATSVKVQYSDDGLNWTDAASAFAISGGTATLDLPAGQPRKRFWRVLAMAVTSGVWGVYEINMYEAASGSHWFDLAQFLMKAWDGSAWVVKQRVFVGECVTGASSVSSVTSYALRGRYTSGRFSLAAGTSYSKSHNLGLAPEKVIVMAAASIGGNLYFTEYWGTGNTGITWGDLSRTAMKVFTHSAKDILTGPSAATTAVEAVIFADRGW